MMKKTKKHEILCLLGFVEMFTNYVSRNMYKNSKLFCQFCKAKNQFHVCNLYKSCKSAKDQLSNFGLIEETMDLSSTYVFSLNTVLIV